MKRRGLDISPQTQLRKRKPRQRQSFPFCLKYLTESLGVIGSTGKRLVRRNTLPRPSRWQIKWDICGSKSQIRLPGLNKLISLPYSANDRLPGVLTRSSQISIILKTPKFHSFYQDKTLFYSSTHARSNGVSHAFFRHHPEQLWTIASTVKLTENWKLDLVIINQPI